MGTQCCAASQEKDDAKHLDQGAVLQSDEPLGKGPAAPAAAQPEYIKEWTVTLRKMGKPLGVDVDLADGKCLFIETLKPGLVSDWNAEHPEQAILREDCIIQVNGVKGEAQALTAACKKDETLELVVVRLSDAARQRRREQYPMEENS